MEQRLYNFPPNTCKVETHIEKKFKPDPFAILYYDLLGRPVFFWLFRMRQGQT